MESIRILDSEDGKVLVDVDVWVGDDALYVRTGEEGFSIETGELCSSGGLPASRLRARKSGYIMLDTSFNRDSLETEITTVSGGLHEVVAFPDVFLMKESNLRR